MFGSLHVIEKIVLVVGLVDDFDDSGQVPTQV
jgi:hypothetical protein